MLTYISPMQKWGSAQRSRFLMEALRRHGTLDVLVLNFVSRGEAEPGCTSSELDGMRVLELTIEKQGLLGRPRLDLPSEEITRRVARHVDLGGYDLIFSRYVKPALKLKLPPGVPLVVDFDDAWYEPPWSTLRTLKMLAGACLRLFNDRVLVQGALRLRSAKHAHFFFCSERERRRFPYLAGSVLPNLPKPPAYPPGQGPDFMPPRVPALLFIGLLDYLPNRDAVDWFLAAIWPRVREAVPQARFLIVGSGEPGRLQAWARQEGVEALGFVDSLADAYAQSSVAVVPMRSGGGTNIKALEPYLYGRAVVATTAVRDGHGDLFREGQDMLCADEAAEFARHCISLLHHPERAQRLAQSGHHRITARLTRERFASVVDAAVRPLLESGPAGGAQVAARG
jgi:polysaccharide biosynthesis protein PslH